MESEFVAVGKIVPIAATAANVIQLVRGKSWFKAEREGINYGQCSKLCGKNQSNMPIAFRGVSEESYGGVARRNEEERRDRPLPFAADDAVAAVRP